MSETKADKNKDSNDISNRRIKAVSTYSPKIIQPLTADMSDLVTLISARSSLNEGVIRNVLTELADVIPYFFQQGRAVKINSLGTLTLRLALDGTFSISHLPDRRLKDAINTPGWFKGKIKNKEMIGKTTEDLVARWNEDHPDDPIE